MKIAIVNGPNLNLLGSREPEIYGSQSFEDFLLTLKQRFVNVDFHYFQSNSEGSIIDHLQALTRQVEGIIINAAGLSHTSIAIADTLKAINLPIVEVHISNIYARETYRQHSFTAATALGVITGLGLEGYALATQYLLGIKR